MVKRRIIATIAASLALIILAVAFVGVLQYVEALPVDDVDGSVYYARKSGGEYLLYDKVFGGSVLRTEVHNEESFYVTKAGTLVKLDPESGEYELIPVDTFDTEDNEKIGFNYRVQIFPHVEGDSVYSIEVHNSTGSYKFERFGHELTKDPDTGLNVYKEDADGKEIKGSFVIDGSEFTPIDQAKLIQLYSAAGYPLAVTKIKEPIKDANGEYSEYGLVPVTDRDRYIVDSTGKIVKTEKYNYEPAYYILTDIDGNRYKMIIGDKLVTGSGYYVQYVDISGETEVKRDAVYVVGTTIGCSLNKIEDYLTPTLGHPLNMNNYHDVDHFVIANRLYEKIDKAPLDELYKTVISFSFIPLEDRQNTANAVIPYEIHEGPVGYAPSDSAISSSCLYNFYSPKLVGVAKFNPTEEEMAEYGFLAKTTNAEGKTVYKRFSKYYVEFNYDVLNSEKNGIEQTIHQKILISDRDFETTGNYYVYTILYNVPEGAKSEADYQMMYSYNMITEIDGHSFGFLRWDEFDWVNPHYIDQNIPYIDKIEISAPNYNFSGVFDLDNTLTDQSQGMSSEFLFVNSSVTDGADTKNSTSFGVMHVYDVSNRVWVITSAGLKIYDLQTGQELKIGKEYTFYEYNAMKQQVFCRKGYIGDQKLDAVQSIYVNGELLAGSAGAQVEVTANNVIVRYADGRAAETYLRYSTELFRKYYESFLYASLVDVYPEEEGEKIMADEANHILTMRVTVKDAKTETVNEYKFYRISARKAYITLNGQGGFYVNLNRVEKFISDAQKYMNNDISIDPSARN